MTAWLGLGSSVFFTRKVQRRADTSRPPAPDNLVARSPVGATTRRNCRTNAMVLRSAHEESIVTRRVVQDHARAQVPQPGDRVVAGRGRIRHEFARRPDRSVRCGRARVPAQEWLVRLHLDPGNQPSAGGLGGIADVEVVAVLTLVVDELEHVDRALERRLLRGVHVAGGKWNLEQGHHLPPNRALSRMLALSASAGCGSFLPLVLAGV